MPLIKWTGGILGVVILGAIGSGVWQLIGEPFVNYLTKITIQGINFIVNSYKDDIYLEASQGFHEASSLSLYMFILMLPFFVVTWVISFRTGYKRADTHYKNKPPSSEPSTASPWLMFYLLAIFIAVILFTKANEKAYINSVITYVEVSLDRLKPYMKEKEIIGLRAEFREVTNANEYYEFREKIESNLKSNNLISKGVPPI